MRDIASTSPEEVTARRPVAGLRFRLVLALLVTSALTLAIAAAAVLVPLERRLRTDELESLATSTRTVAPLLDAVPRRDLRPGSATLDAAVTRAAGRVDAQLLVVDSAGRLLESTVARAGDRPADALRALRTGRPVRRIVGEGRTAEARYALRADSGDAPVGIVLFKDLREVTAATGTVRNATTVAALTGLVVALLVGLVLSAGFVRRLRALRDTALLVSRFGPVVEMAPDRAGDEVGDLTRAFATMQRRLREQEDARRTFVSTASHELRTPLASLRLMLELAREGLEREPADVHEVHADVARAEEQAERLGALADQLLDLSRLDAGLGPERVLIDATQLARAVAREFTDRAARQEQRLEVAAADGIQAVADPGAAAQILRILLDNALRFGPSGSTVDLAVAAEPAGCVIAVRDHGQGVPNDEREPIFERFRRGSDTGGVGGFGLGLAIARQLARRMDGDLTLSDTTPGAHFELTLPAPPLSTPGRDVDEDAV